MGRNLVETVMGAVVLMIAGFFLVFAYNTSNLRPIAGYAVRALFSSVEGLEPGSDVRIGGVKVGSVTGQTLHPGDYRAELIMSIRQGIKLPVDTKAIISGDSLLGGKNVKLEPGGSDKFIQPGGEITKTEGAVILEQTLGRAIFLLSGGDDNNK
ncbi:MAG: outer membrane lipid asymmetry maintenance protein MlaD [Candidatus Eiseniibacteriota bacterium]